MKRSTLHSRLMHSGLLLGLIVIVAGLTVVGFRMAGMMCEVRSVAIATLVACIALVPPLWLEIFIGPSVAGPTAVVFWRLGVLLPAVLFTTYQIEPSRKCCQVTLLACYLVTLPLESWLLIRQTRQ
jgi:hypothetical protein